MNRIGMVKAIVVGAVMVMSTGASPVMSAQAAGAAKAPAGSFHEPPGMAVQINTGPLTSTATFSNFSPATTSGYGEWSGNLTTVPGSTGLRIMYQPNLVGGGSPVRFGIGIPSAGTGWYYQRMEVRFSTNWTLAGNVAMKFCEPRTQQEGSGQGPNENHVIGAHDFQTPFMTKSFLYVLLQGPNGHFQNLREQPEFIAASNLSGGAWHLVEVLFAPESIPGAGDGAYTGWVDGVQIAHWTSVLWLAPGNKVGWRYLMFDPTYGGGRHSPPQPMYWDVDQLYVSTR